MEATERFQTLWEQTWRTNAAPDAAALIAAYRHPSRHYHNLAHIVQCLEVVAAYEAATGSAAAMELRLALFYHDAVYDSTRKDNEEASARLAREALSPWLPAEGVRTVERLITMTDHLRVPLLADEQLIVDADLSILGTPAETFDAYEAAIRREYAWVPEDRYRTGRAIVLRNFLNRPSIYSTGWFRGQYEAPARVNLERSIARLGGGTSKS